MLLEIGKGKGSVAAQPTPERNFILSHMTFYHMPYGRPLLSIKMTSSTLVRQFASFPRHLQNMKTNMSLLLRDRHRILTLKNVLFTTLFNLFLGPSGDVATWIWFQQVMVNDMYSAPIGDLVQHITFLTFDYIRPTPATI